MSEKQIKAYLSKDEHRIVKKHCADMNISMSHFVILSIKDRMDKDILERQRK